MKNYRLKQWYPSLHKDWVVGDIVIPWEKQKDYYHVPNKSTTIFKEEVENNPDFWELIEEREPLFVAGDGAIFFNDVYYLVTKPYFVKTKLKAKESVYKGGGFIYFKHESNADEYILWNKPLLSLKDIDETIKMYSYEFDELKKLAREKIKQ